MSAEEAEARLRARLADDGDGQEAEYAKTWDPRKGDANTVIGRLVSVAEVETRFGPAEVATIETPDGPRAIWLTAATIKSAWLREAPQVGEIVAVKYGGDRTTTDGQRSYPIFKVAVDRPVDAGERYGAEAPF